jgi:hypothetical protein
MKLRPSKDLKSAKLKADKYFSLYIRQRDKDKPCVTCGGGGVKDCGHFISRRFESVRFDEKNASGQCKKCNRYEYGNQFEHGVQIDIRYGKGTAESLRLKSKMFCKRNKFDYEYIAQEYADKL